MLKQFLADNRISIYSLAKRCDISYSALNDLANGKTDIENMRLGPAVKLSEALGITLQQLISICRYEKQVTSPVHGIPCRISTKNKSYYADFIYNGEPVSLRICNVTERNARYLDTIAGWRADKYASKKQLEAF